MKKSTKWLIGLVITVGVLIWAGNAFITKVQNGYVGVVYSANGGVQNDTLPQGWHLKGAFSKVIQYPIRLQTVEYKDVQTATSDGKNITIEHISFNYQIEPHKVIEAFKTFGAISSSTIEDNYLRTRLADAARKAISQYTVIDIYGEKSSNAAADIQKKFTDNISKLGFVVSDLTLGVPKADPNTQAAIDKRVEASQELDRKTTEKLIAQQEADRKFIEAQGEANAKIEEARGVSEANKKLQQSITPDLIEYQKWSKWNGVLPTTNLEASNGTDVMVNVPSANTTSDSK